MSRWRGVGIGLREPLWSALRETKRSVDWLEFVPENFVEHGGWRRKMLDEAAERWHLVAHGVSISVGGPDPLDVGYLKRLKQVLDAVGVAVYTDHLCWTSVGGRQYHDLLPLPFTEEAVRWTAERARRVSEALERPLLLENITYYAEMPGPELAEGDFIRAVLEESGAHLLLDVSNTYLNAVNHGRDPLEVLEALPLDRTRQIHLAGYESDPEGVLLDHHGSPVSQGVWALFQEAIRKVGDVPTLIERDNNIPPLDVVLDEADEARALQAATLEDTAVA